MSQKANLITLRKRSPTLNISTEHPRLVVHLITFANTFIKLLSKQGIWVIATKLFLQNNICKLHAVIYISAKQLIFYKKLPLTNLTNKHNFFNKKSCFTKIFFKFFNRYKINVYSFNFNCLNSQINIKLVKNFYPLVRSQIKRLFIRRFNLLLDFLSINALFSQNLFSAEKYLELLAKVFQYLTKRQHSSFISFMEKLFKEICLKSSIKGIKLIINGKLKGKTRASKAIIEYGGVSNQTINAEIDFAIVNTHTRMGAFGFRLWVQRT